ncbi:MAG: hypothetical protein EON60_10305 [Alphaproteobacteria bacterium]|nr:MAG: hypothetical protein EON60_10305 [Alphaproteobacteria bacterium]
MTLQTFLPLFLGGKLDGNTTFEDHGISHPDQFTMLCHELERREGVNIHPGELSAQMSLNELTAQISTYKFGNAWRNRVLYPQQSALPFASVVSSFR